jgi:glycerol-3-phosphate acyltransferase PlsX
MRVASRLVRDGCAQAMVSAGNTGAVMATAKMTQGVVPGVKRPALVGIFPTMEQKPVVMVDVGANVDCDAQMLGQFAVMAEIYSRKVLHTQNPRVGILSIGEEEHKGNELTKTAAHLLKTLPLNFIGNVEGRDLYTGLADVIVCDGFIGNVALKVSEGLVEVIKHMLKESLESSLTNKIGYLLSRDAYKDFRKRMDYSEYGGAPLLGVKGAYVIGHGRSDGRAVMNALRVARAYVEHDVGSKIEADLARVGATSGGEA